MIYANATALAGAALSQLRNAASSYFWGTAVSYTHTLGQQRAVALSTAAGDASRGRETRPDIHHVGFNQDASCLVVCHEQGYHMYSSNNLDQLTCLYKNDSPDKPFIVERLFQSGLILIVTSAHSRRIQAFDLNTGNAICCHYYTGAVKSVKMNRKRVVVCLEDAIHIHDIKDMNLLHVIRDTPQNQDGLMSLCSSEAASYLAYPGSSTHGHVNIFDTGKITPACTIAAHQAPLAAVSFNSDGTRLATASTKGTVIRVFGIPRGERLYEFTRGIMRFVKISCLSFSPDSRHLCSSSDTETVHVFLMDKQEQEKRDNPVVEQTQPSTSSWIPPTSSYLPQHVNELMSREKSFATARLPFVGTKTCCAMLRIKNEDVVAVASAEGYLFFYSLPGEPGECTLHRQFKIGPEADNEPDQIEGKRPNNTEPSSTSFYPELS